MAEMPVTIPPAGPGVAAPGTVRLRPEARQNGPDGRTVLYLLQIEEQGKGTAVNVRSAMQFPELARVGRGLRRLVRAAEPFAGLAMGWQVTLRGEPAAAGCTLTFTLEEKGVTMDYPVFATGAVVEAFVDGLEAEVTALP
jgi:hypothetical protein